MAISNIREQVLSDFRDKLILERELGKELRTLDRSIVRQFHDDMLRGQVTRADDFETDLEKVLSNHYQNVADKFGGKIEDQVNDDVKLSDEEKEELVLVLILFIRRRASTQSKIISATTQKDMRTAAQIVAAETADQVERAAVSAAILSRRLQVREISIAGLETQAMAEAVKSAEFDVLAKKTPLTMESTKKPLFKEWVTVGDGRVRPAHIEGDSQVVLVNIPFNIGGQQLRWPGDTSLGATAANVINCRCSAVYDTGAVADFRRSEGGT